MNTSVGKTTAMLEQVCDAIQGGCPRVQIITHTYAFGITYVLPRLWDLLKERGEAVKRVDFNQLVVGDHGQTVRVVSEANEILIKTSPTWSNFADHASSYVEVTPLGGTKRDNDSFGGGEGSV